MPLQPCEAPGRYAGFLTKMALGQTSGGCVTLMVDSELRAEFSEERDKWEALQGSPLEMSGRLILTKRTGDINGYTYGILKGALNWDGKDIAELQTRDFSEVKVAIHVGEDDYRGEGALGIDFISALDWTPGINKATGKELEKIKAKWAAAKPDKPDEQAEPPVPDYGDKLPPDSDIPF